ncbi:site-specific DNA-methyltransferase [Aerosakkonema funiforme]|uniref:site-specific DNA-methyltransferase n=1 Tax=Aerosakkonema funiforme TaxID=1246630 RepID=UPI001F54DE3D|nr:site-specific DNA-methyltransferase [Aerosakkonema funiforme]
MKQLSLFEDPLPKEKLPTNLTTNRHHIHKWYNFIAGFSPEFVSKCIQNAELKADEIIIDPFAGLSTTLVQANLEGVCSVGFEAHPFFYDISLAKIFPPKHPQQVKDIETFCQSLDPYERNLTNIWETSALTFLEKLIPESELPILASAIIAEDRLSPDRRSLYRLILSRVLELTAHSQTDGIYKAPTTQKSSLPYHDAVRKVCAQIQDDIDVIGNSFKSSAKLHLMSSEKMLPLANESVSICITSPPYLNNFDFAEMTRMQLYFWRYASSWKEITERVRRRLIVNTTTAPTDLKRNQHLFSESLSKCFRSEIQPLVEALKQQKQLRKGKKDYYLLLYPYFAQMQSVIRELKRVLRPQSPVHLVVADAALYGVHIQTDKLLAQLMQENGFQVLKIETLRARGSRWLLEKRQGTEKGLGEFHIYARRI